jgi:hypothetical protein
MRAVKLSSKDLDACSEVSLALAQATMQQAIDASGLDKSTVAMRFCDSPRRRWAAGHLDRLLSGECDLTLRDMGRLLAICGFEPRFDRIPRLKLGRGVSSHLFRPERLVIHKPAARALQSHYSPSWLHKGAKIRYLGCRNGSDDVFVVSLVERDSKKRLPTWFVATQRDPLDGREKAVIVYCTPEDMRLWVKHEGDG